MANDLVEFDPEVVAYYDAVICQPRISPHRKPSLQYVKAFDYDSLLSLYRELKEKKQSKCASATSE